MNLFELKKSIRHETVGHIYVFYGLEREGMKIYWEQIGCRTNRDVILIDTVRDIFGYRRSLLDRAKVFVCTNDKEFTTSETAWDKVVNSLGDNILILTYDTVNKNSKFYKRFSDVCVEFEYFTRQVLTYHIQKHIPDLSEPLCNDLISACGGSYGRLLLEIDKITRIHEALPDWTSDEVVAEMLTRGVIHEDVGDLIFDLGNAILRKDKVSAYTYAHEGDIPPLKLIQVLYNGFRRLLLVQRGKEQGLKETEISKETGISTREIWGISQNVKIRSSEDLIECLHLLRKCEKSIKEGVLCEEHTIDYLLIKLM